MLYDRNVVDWSLKQWASYLQSIKKHEGFGMG